VAKHFICAFAKNTKFQTFVLLSVFVPSWQSLICACAKKIKITKQILRATAFVAKHFICACSKKVNGNCKINCFFMKPILNKKNRKTKGNCCGFLGNKK
jgi:hypothetical protein